MQIGFSVGTLFHAHSKLVPDPRKFMGTLRVYDGNLHVQSFLSYFTFFLEQGLVRPRLASNCLQSQG